MRLNNGYFRDLPNMIQLFDYDVRTDGQPVYLGYAPIDTAQATARWVIFKFTYNGSGFVTQIESVGEGAWSVRSTYF